MGGVAVWLAAAKEDFVFAGRDGAGTAGVHLRECTGIEFEGDAFGFAGSKMDALEAGESELWREIGFGWC